MQQTFPLLPREIERIITFSDEGDFGSDCVSQLHQQFNELWFRPVSVIFGFFTGSLEKSNENVLAEDGTHSSRRWPRHLFDLEWNDWLAKSYRQVHLKRVANIHTHTDMHPDLVVNSLESYVLTRVSLKRELQFVITVHHVSSICQTNC